MPNDDVMIKVITSSHKVYELKKYIEDTTCIRKLKFVVAYKQRKTTFFGKTAKK